MNVNPTISIVSPVYNAEDIVDVLVDRVLAEIENITTEYEIVLVNDGSSDESWNRIHSRAQQNVKVKAINLSRNFGQHQALTCGLQLSKGDYVVVMDCDLQENPRYILPLYQEIKKGYDIVYTTRKRLGHSYRKNIATYLFNGVFNYLVNRPNETTRGDVGTLSIINRKVVNAFCTIGDYERLYLMTLRWMGFNSSEITIEHDKRYSGKSTYTFKKLIDHAIIGITYQSAKLLKLNITVGFIIAIFALVAAAIVIAMYFISGFMNGWASLIVTMFFMLGALLMSIGILGLYIGKIFDQVKGRPKFIISESVNVAENETIPITD